MESLIIYPENQNQFSAIKAFLEETKIRFTTQNAEYELLEDWQKERIEVGLKDIKEKKLRLGRNVHKKATEICMK